MDQGYRIVSVDVVTSTPLRFAATFVQNTGVYNKTNCGFAPAYTVTDLSALLADTSRRVVDLAPYYAGNTLLYGVTWIGNTGLSQKRYKVARHTTWSGLQAAATSGGSWRLTDLELVRQPSPLFCGTPTGCPSSRS